MSQLITRKGFGREPGRSKADRSVLSARRGRFSPNCFLKRPAGKTGRLVLRGRPPVQRHLRGLRTVAAVCLAGFVLFGSTSTASGETRRAKGSAKKSSESSSSSGSKTAYRSSGNTSTTTTRTPDYKSRFKPVKPPPPADGGRPSRKEKVRDKERPPKEKKPRPDPPPPIVDPPRPEPPINPPWPPPHPIPEPPWPPSYEIIEYIYIESYPYYEEEQPATNVETASMILTSATLVWNASYIRSGDSNAFVATTGIFTGLSSLAMAFSDRARYPILDFLLGTTQLVFSIANLSNGVEFTSPAEDDGYHADYYYSTAPTNGISYSYSF